jgi:ubiquinone/menaquinone biosynthesis C-methylase UbiE
MGELSILVAQKGFQTCGFDLSTTAIEVARESAKGAGISELTRFDVANAQELPYEDEQFDVVFGKAVLHHTVKYARTEHELHRIMKPAAKAYFLEGAANNPLIWLAKLVTIHRDLGDIALTYRTLREWSRPFSSLRVRGYFFLYMLKRFGFTGYDKRLQRRRRNALGKSPLFNPFLRVCLAVDDLIVNERPYSKYLAGRYIVELTK